MPDRSNHELNVYLERKIDAWSGTAWGEDLRNMYENGSSYETICEYIGEDYADWEE
jgi:hypothetical protein